MTVLAADQAAADVPTVVAGDLATSDRSAGLRELTRGALIDPALRVPAGLGLTWSPAGSGLPPLLRRDYVLFGPPLEARELRVLDIEIAAPHRPVIARVIDPR